jgi:hypothetical protein
MLANIKWQEKKVHKNLETLGKYEINTDNLSTGNENF